MKEVITTGEATIGEDPTARIRPLTGPVATKLITKDTAHIANAKTMPRMRVKPVLNVGRFNISAASAEVLLLTI